MPTPDEELDALFASDGAKPAAKAKTPDEELDELFASDSAPAPAPAEHKVIEMPEQLITGDVPKPEQKPWYSRFLPNREAALHGAAQGATLNFGDEGAAALSTAASKLFGPKDPEGFDREYAAGSQYEDMRRGMQAEDDKLRKENPGSFMAGEALGAAPLAIAAGGTASKALTPLLRGGLGMGSTAAGTAESGIVGGALGAASGAGADAENRLRGAGRGAVEGAALGAGLHGAAEGLNQTAKNAFDASNRLITQVFMTPAQRSAYEKAHGLDSIRELGEKTRAAGLYKGWRPTTAAKVARNANKVMTESGGEITGFEDDLAKQGINPDVQVTPVADELRSEAAALPKRVRGSDKLAAPMTEQADLLEGVTPVSVAGKVEKPPTLPEWSLNKPKSPKYGAVIEPVQEPLPGTELPPVAADRPLPPPVEPEQLSMPTPRAMPDKQLELNLPPRSHLAYSPEPTQMQMDLPRQQPSQQLGLPLEPQQGQLRLPPAEAAKNARPQMTFDQLPVKLPSGGAAQEQLPGLAQLDPAKPQAPAIEPPAGAPAPEQLGLDLPARQVPAPMDLSRRPLPFRPGEMNGQQMNLPVQQELPLPPRAPAAPAPAPAARTPPPAPVQHEFPLDLTSKNRGPQPEQSIPLPDTNAQVVDQSVPFTEASAMKRLLGKQIDWENNPRTQQSPSDLGDNTARKVAWKGIAQQIDAALKGDKRIDPTKLGDYNKAKQDYSAAATAFDPSVKMMERQAEMGLGARDLVAGTLFGGGNPLTGGLAARANKTMAGMGPAMGSTVLRGGAHVSKGLMAPLLKAGAKVSPIVRAREANPTGTDAEVRQEANDQVKKDLAALLEQGRNK